jgi:hypothetical protein
MNVNNQRAVQQAVNTLVDEVENEEAAVAVSTPAGTPVKVGDTFVGITKQPSSAANAQINGLWNVADNTGNAAIDHALNNFAAANSGNPQAVAALEGAASAIKQNPQAFINLDGSVNKQALGDLLMQKFASVGEVTVPSLS